MENEKKGRIPKAANPEFQEEITFLKNEANMDGVSEAEKLEKILAAEFLRKISAVNLRKRAEWNDFLRLAFRYVNQFRQLPVEKQEAVLENGYGLAIKILRKFDANKKNIML